MKTDAEIRALLEKKRLLSVLSRFGIEIGFAQLVQVETGVEVIFQDPGNLKSISFAKPVVWISNIDPHKKQKNTVPALIRLAWCLGITAFIIPYVIIGALTKFQNGGSTSMERGWMMSWLV
jgi:hypothetical protein